MYLKYIVSKLTSKKTGPNLPATVQDGSITLYCRRVQDLFFRLPPKTGLPLGHLFETPIIRSPSQHSNRHTSTGINGGSALL